jgi:hypothetical protein
MRNLIKICLFSIFSVIISLSLYINSGFIFSNILVNTGKSDSSFSSSTSNNDYIPAKTKKITFKIEDISNLNEQIEEYLLDLYPVISDKAVSEIVSTKFITKTLIVDTLGIVDFYLNFFIPEHYTAEKINFLWELNIPEFQSRLFQIYGIDTFLIDTWPNVVGKPSTKTYTGHYEAFRLRNWPFWKDPEAGDSVRPTPPGPNNPLGLFVVHYDENSLRYFHGTNKNFLLKNEYRALSHGCVRNDNGNIAKMKEFIIKKLIRSDDLSSWLGSKKTMIYEIKVQDRFPVRIIYKLFDIATDENGIYLIFFKDVYGYAKGSKWSKYDEEELMMFISLENILSEIKREFPKYNIPHDRLIPVIESLIASHKDYQKYYLSDYLNVEKGN